MNWSEMTLSQRVAAVPQYIMIGAITAAGLMVPIVFAIAEWMKREQHRQPNERSIREQLVDGLTYGTPQGRR